MGSTGAIPARLKTSSAAAARVRLPFASNDLRVSRSKWKYGEPGIRRDYLRRPSISRSALRTVRPGGGRYVPLADRPGDRYIARERASSTRYPLDYSYNEESSLKR